MKKSKTKVTLVVFLFLFIVISDLLDVVKDAVLTVLCATILMILVWVIKMTEIGMMYWKLKQELWVTAIVYS